MGKYTTGDFFGEDSSEYLIYKMLQEIQDNESNREVAFDTFPAALGTSLALDTATSSNWVAQGTLLNIKESINLSSSTLLKMLVTELPEYASLNWIVIPAIYQYTGSEYTLIASGSRRSFMQTGWVSLELDASSDIRLRSYRTYYAVLIHKIPECSVLGYEGTPVDVNPFISWSAELGAVDIEGVPETINNVTRSTSRLYSQLLANTID